MLEQVKLFLKNDKYYLFIYFYFFLMPWNFFKWQMGAFTVVLFIWWILKFRKSILSKLKTMILFKPLFFLILFVIYTYIASLWSEDIKEGFSYVNKFHKYYFLLIPVLFTSIDKTKVINIIKVFLISFFLYALFSLGIYFDFYSISDSTVTNPKGIMAYAIVSIYMSITVIWSIFFVFFDKNNLITKISLTIIFLISLFALFANNSRTAQASLIITVIILILINFKILFKNKKYLYLLPILILLISTYIKLNDKLLNKYDKALIEVNNIFINNNYSGSFGVRLYFYKAGFKVINENFLFGLGPVDNKKELYKIQKNDINYCNDKLYTSYHSQHLDIFTAYGVIGYLLIFISCLTLLYNLKNLTKYYYFGLSFFLIVFFNSLANVILIKKPFNYIFISIFVLLSVVAYSNKKEEHLD